MTDVQQGILNALPRQARYLVFSLRPDTNPVDAVRELARECNGEDSVVGLGPSLLDALNSKIEGMRNFPVCSTAAVDIPSTPASLFIWLRGSDRGELVHEARKMEKIVLPAFDLIKVIDAFQYADSRDLSGYVDGTENPQDDDAVDAALVKDKGAGMDGSSFVAVQQWLHDLDYMSSLPRNEMDHVIGRRLSDNEEIEDAPESAHVKRTAQEDFDPEAFVLRRSMPWADESAEGLVFVAFGKSFDAFEALLNRMLGVDDGIVDGLFRISQPVSGYYFWCPPARDGHLDLQALGL